MDTSCLTCEKVFSKKNLRGHVKEFQDQRKYTCDQCQKHFIGNKRFNNHKMSHLAITCKLCGLQIQRNSRTSHKIKCSENVKEKVNFFVTTMIIRLIGRTVSFDTKNHEEKESEGYSCSHCDKTFKKNHSLLQHVKTHSNMVPLLQNIASKLVEKMKKESKIKSKKFECN